MEEIVYHTNYKLENSYWWFLARNNIVRRVMEKVAKLDVGATILDVGCGTGGFASNLLDKYEVIGLDTSEIALEYSRKRGIKTLYSMTLDEFPRDNHKINAITILDVIEHIEGDAEVVEDCFKVIEKGGYVIATVPAYRFMWSKHDEMHMHYRRYTKDEINLLFEQAGFDLVYSSYFNFFLFLPALLKRYYDKLRGSAPIKPVDKVPEFLNKLFEKIFKFEGLLMPGIKFPFGLSIITIAKKIT